MILGLGNPGETFRGTRHNVGFEVIQVLGERHAVEVRHTIISAIDGRPAGVHGEYQEGQDTVRLQMPLTMMNEAGVVLRDLTAAPYDLLVVCDDVNLPLGTIRLRPEGSAGGHHGLQSCLDVVGTEQVPRLRIGVGMKDLPRELRDFVLAPFHRAERPVVKHAIEQAADSCEMWVKEGIDAAMNRYNTRVVG